MEQNKNLDLSVEYIKSLHKKIQAQDDDIYTFLQKEFPDMVVEDRLKYLATILNDFFDDYTFDENDEMRRDGYIIKRFFPNKKEI
ncbi:hypothetical protein [Hydrogenimonas thermophila]|uniref:Uncharacterized protein n=1 Tax=Hydrogenimonas thermophila TaxID=223786 RepID=A0A1I5NLJ2_9BACT|nr:hypothetical protein [Hydrogenimonas thermophila]WOE69271.1 hypothetical protein RZR91_09145 [Hydrogenimonas thermophila]WOE71781.1 hypothetical protein RZR97_09120 [Hydrogenimonas thermophila]SFP22708.1 hypothetical protein SAMN05216234_11121 [Hydrogenimonas thermophila]